MSAKDQEPQRVEGLAPARRFGLHPAPAGRYPPRVLLTPHVRRGVPLGVVIAGLLMITLLWRRWQALHGWLLAMLTSGVAVGLLGVWEALVPKLERITVPVATLPPALNGLVIAHISDIHLDEPLVGRTAPRMLRQVMAAQPDLIVITGDFVSYRVPVAPLTALLTPLHAPLGVYGIWGNHDYWADVHLLERVITDAGVTLLRNSHVVLEHNGARFVLAGTDDQWMGHADLDQALRDAAPNLPRVLLAHEPDMADRAATHGVMLQLSGHTHGGQVALPYIGPILLPRHGWQYVRDLHRVGAMWLYVSRGLGSLPFRLGCRAEVTLLRLVRESAN